MASKRICSVDGCGKTHLARGLCGTHYTRWQRTGSAEGPNRTPRGAPLAFIKAALQGDTAECVHWPFAKHRAGFGLITLQGRTQVAARVVCTMAHGKPPNRKLQAAHSCGNGHLGCINPKHLRWATREENANDQLLHGTRLRGERATTNILSEQQVLEIRNLLKTEKQSYIAALYGVSQSTVQTIKSGRNWGWLTSSQTPSEPPRSSH
jgi:hypothetical protein